MRVGPPFLNMTAPSLSLFFNLKLGLVFCSSAGGENHFIVFMKAISPVAAHCLAGRDTVFMDLGNLLPTFPLYAMHCRVQINKSSFKAAAQTRHRRGELLFFLVHGVFQSCFFIYKTKNNTLLHFPHELSVAIDNFFFYFAWNAPFVFV